MHFNSMYAMKGSVLGFHHNAFEFYVCNERFHIRVHTDN
jgi:hypothetical protein